MGRTVKDKHIKTSLRAKSVKPSSSNVDYNNNNNNNNSNSNNNNGNNDEFNSNTAKNRGFVDYGWGYCTEEQLEEILLKQLKDLYADAVSKLVALGYDKEVALKAVLRNGHCYGGMDVLANVLRNSMNYLLNGNDDEPERAFTDLKELEEYSLAGMVCLLQQVHPHLSRGDAMWCLLMSELHLGRASTMDLAKVRRSRNVSGDGMSNVESGSTAADGSGVGVPPGLCKFHGGWGFGNEGNLEAPVNGVGEGVSGSEASIPKETDCAHRFEIIPPMKSLLQRNVAACADGFRSKQQQQKPQVQSQPYASLTTNGDSSKAFVPATDVAPSKACQESLGNNQDVANSVLNKFRDLNLDDTLDRLTEDQKEEMVLALLHQVNDLEKQVNERKDWAHQKAMQAARKLSSDLTELKILRMEREETQRLKRVKQVLEDNTMKRLSEMENALRKASSQVDCANAAVRQLEMENAEIRAEMEASKLSASESVTTCLEVSKREKKSLKKLLAWEKQKAKLQDEIAAAKQKFYSLQQQLVQIHAAQKEAEAKWIQEVKDKELAMALVEEERRSKETTEVNNKRKLEALRSRIEMEFQRHKDDLQRLEQELSRLKEASHYLEPNKHLNIFSTGIPGKAKHQGQTIANLLRELDEPERGGTERECMICLRDEVSVVFLPCAHQVMCASCGEEYGKRAKAACPCCRVPIEQRIRVFGASS